MQRFSQESTAENSWYRYPLIPHTEMIKRLLAVILTACSAAAVSYADNIKWLSTSYDFGTIHEDAGKAHGQVQFVNLGPEATIIQNVKSTCGCTGVDYTKDIIAPGDTATIWFDYNPTGRPGRFLKHIKAYTGLDNELMSIEIKGTVIGAPQSLDTKYPVTSGYLRLSSDLIPMGKTLYGTSRHEYLHGYNQASDTLHLSWEGVPKYISLGASSLQIAPGDLFTLSAYMNTRDGAEIGTLDAPFTLIADYGTEHRELTVHVTAEIVPDTSAYTEQQLREAPAASVFPTLIELGDMSADKAVKPLQVEFAIRNEGKTPLSIKRIHCPELPQLFKIKSMPKSLKPEQWKPVKGTVDTAVLPQGNFKIAIEVVTDDPLHPVRNVFIIGTK